MDPTVIEADRLNHERALDHCWRYFQLHAVQRLTVFNFYVVLAGLVAAGLSATLQGSPRFAMLGVVLGLILSLLSYVFWKLDQRGSFLVKHAEEAMSEMENATLPEISRLFMREPKRFQTQRIARGLWTFGRSFRLVFGVMAAFGLCGAFIAGLRAAELFSWS